MQPPVEERSRERKPPRETEAWYAQQEVTRCPLPTESVTAGKQGESHRPYVVRNLHTPEAALCRRLNLRRESQ